MRIYVGNLNFDVDEEQVITLFEKFGYVKDCWIPREKVSRYTRGFCFVDIPDDQSALLAIRELDGQEFLGRTIKVSEAHPRPAKE